ncbi:hypothetical protein [Schinkia azotoformans]|uniref:hypothetical protein n=1 Tax=Schinkia azotoformans TaxID=1454 RepID=UPI002DB802DD|nr:hypothetical protein [Schinkia azotoformans]MEC1714713.1 hypothetical protein [Schinkia azotoformans]MEC1757531.1 hypothetical protein [Schinkia azotoformans]
MIKVRFSISRVMKAREIRESFRYLKSNPEAFNLMKDREYRHKQIFEAQRSYLEQNNKQKEKAANAVTLTA